MEIPWGQKGLLKLGHHRPPKFVESPRCDGDGNEDGDSVREQPRLPYGSCLKQSPLPYTAAEP